MEEVKVRKVHRLNVYIAWISRLCAIAFVAFFVVGQFVYRNPTSIDNSVYEFSNNWIIEGSGEILDFPTFVELEKGESLTVYNTLPNNLKNGNIMALYTLGNCEVYIDDELVMRFDSKDKVIPGDYTKDVWMPFEVNETDAGKTIKIVRNDPTLYNGSFKRIYYGTQIGVANNLIRNNSSPFVLMIILLAFTVFSILVIFTIQFKMKQKIHQTSLLIGILLACFWIVFDSPLYQFLFTNRYIDGCLSYMSGMIAPYFFVHYLDEVQKHRYERHFTFTSALIIANFIIFTILHFTGIASFRQTQFVMNLTLGLIAIAIFGVIAFDYEPGYIKEYKWTAIGYIGFGGFAVASLFIINISEAPETWSGLAVAYGLYILWLFTCIQTVVDISVEISNSRRALEESQLKSNFLANMSHEIRTPINAVLGLDEMIIRESNDEIIRNYALDIRSSGSQLLSLVNDILDISKIESGKFQINPFDFDIANLINDVNNMIAPKAASKGLELKIDVDENIPSIIHGDEVRIKQCLVNILNNAVKYTDFGSVTLRMEAETLDDDFINLRFVVKDTGQGMKSEDLARLSRPFERFDETRNRNVEGTGLGMAITQQLISMMDSKLEVESTYGEGSIFAFTIKQKVVDKQPIGSFEIAYRRLRGKQESNESFIAQDASILYVDDMSVNLTVFKGLLKHTKMNIMTCMSGKDAINLSKNQCFDIIFIDHMMPDMDGIETMYHIHFDQDSMNRSTPMVIVTANAVAGAREMYIRQGFSDYLSKPIEPQKLEALIMKYLPEDMIEIVKSEDVETSENAGRIIRNIENSKNFDAEEGIKASGNADLFVAALKDFHTACDERCAKIKEFYENGDIHAYMIEVHALKSSAHLVGAMRLSLKAATLEEAARAMDIIPIEMETDELLELYGNVKAELDDLFSEDYVRKPIAKEQLDLLFDSMLDAVCNFDYDIASSIMNELAKYELPENAKQTFKNLNRKMVEVDFEGMEEILKNRSE